MRDIPSPGNVRLEVGTQSSTGFSPYEIAFGRQMMGPLDILYSGWVEDRYQMSDITLWVEPFK